MSINSITDTVSLSVPVYSPQDVLKICKVEVLKHVLYFDQIQYLVSCKIKLETNLQMLCVFVKLYGSLFSLTKFHVFKGYRHNFM